MNKINLISVIDMMIGLTEREEKVLQSMDEEEVERYYINSFQEQNDAQLEITF